MKTIKFFSMAALAIVGAIMTSCSSDNNNEVVTPPQPVNTDKVVTLTTTVSMGNSGPGTRLLDAEGVKTFAVGDKIAVIYKNTSDQTKKAESVELTAGDITDEGKSATFTVTLTNPKASTKVRYIYPYDMAATPVETDAAVDGDATVEYDNLLSQDGTLSSLSSDLDLAIYDGTLTASAGLPTEKVTLQNKLAILAFTLNKADGSSEITSSITVFSLTDGSRTYTVNRKAEDGPIYVAIRPITSATTINFLAHAKDTKKYYAKYAEGKKYSAGNIYQLGMKMPEIIFGQFTVNPSGDKVYFSPGNLQATTSDLGSTWTWAFAEHQWDKIGGKDQSGVGTPTGNNYINGDGTLSANGTVDLFGWSTDATHLGIHNSKINSTYSGAFADWGEAPEVTATIGTGWRTLTRVEWDYLLNPNADKHRSGMQYYKAQVNGVNGLIVFPDDWDDSYHHLSSEYVNNNAISFENTKINESTWTNDFEANGAVFLPVAGQRHVDKDYVEYPNGRGHYWSATSAGDETAYRVYFTGSSSEWSYGVGSSRRFGYAVRLVYPIK